MQQTDIETEALKRELHELRCEMARIAGMCDAAIEFKMKDLSHIVEMVGETAAKALERKHGQH